MVFEREPEEVVARLHDVSRGLRRKNDGDFGGREWGDGKGGGCRAPELGIGWNQQNLADVNESGRQPIGRLNGIDAGVVFKRNMEKRIARLNGVFVTIGEGEVNRRDGRDRWRWSADGW